MREVQVFDPSPWEWRMETESIESYLARTEARIESLQEELNYARTHRLEERLNHVVATINGDRPGYSGRHRQSEQLAFPTDPQMPTHMEVRRAAEERLSWLEGPEHLDGD